jgi:ribonuclease Z
MAAARRDGRHSAAHATLQPATGRRYIPRPHAPSMSLTLRFLGTAASRPTVERNVSSIAVTREGETLLIDCGEGTQRQMMRYGVSFALADIFFTHMHTDHVLGVIGLTRTFQLGGRTEPLRLWGPRGSSRVLRQALGFGGDRLAFPVEVLEVEPGTPIARKDHAVLPYAVEHPGSVAVGYAIVEPERRGRFDPEAARALGVPEGPLWGRLHRGETITLDDGTTVNAATLVGPTRPGRTVVITGDTRPCAATVDVARGADVRRLVLTHISARYSRDARELESQARELFAATSVVRDGAEIDVPYADAATTDTVKTGGA